MLISLKKTLSQQRVTVRDQICRPRGPAELTCKPTLHGTQPQQCPPQADLLPTHNAVAPESRAGWRDGRQSPELSCSSETQLPWLAGRLPSLLGPPGLVGGNSDVAVSPPCCVTRGQL